MHCQTGPGTRFHVHSAGDRYRSLAGRRLRPGECTALTHTRALHPHGFQWGGLHTDRWKVLRAERVVRNQIFFREVNEKIRAAELRLSGAAERAEVHFHFLCECAKRGCLEWIALSADEYEAVRKGPLAFAVA